MGNVTSVDPRHARIWLNLSSLQSDQARMQMLDTLMAGPEFVNSAKRAGVYSDVLQWIAAYKRGEFALWPGLRSNIPVAPDIRLPQMNQPRKVVKENSLATVPAPKKALDALHEAYRVLGLDDTKPLTHELLKSAYRKAASKAHPDRGGDSRVFDEVTRAFMYVEEVLKKIAPMASEYTPVDTGTTISSYKPAPDAVRLEGRVAPSASVDHPVAPPPVSLNPKNLNMTVFNKLFEENRLPDPDSDGYGDWLKSHDGAGTSSAGGGGLRDKFNADIFNKMFIESGGKTATSQVAAPSEIVHAVGVELGAGRPVQYTAAMGSRVNYTDLKFAYGEGSTYSHQVANVTTANRSFEDMKRERESNPVALTAAELAALNVVDQHKKQQEEERKKRLSAMDTNTEDVYMRMQSRLRIQN
jgi:hypothetical protein